MTIKHLVIAGGGLLGFRYFGALKRLEEVGFWKKENVESIYGTSVGSILGTCIALKYDWETLERFIVEKPWQDEFVVNGKQIFEAYSTKGLYDIKLFEAIFKPLLGALDLSLDITLKQLYEFNPVDLHIYTFEMNSFKTIDLSHTTHPDLRLLEAITMSSAIPGLVKPIIKTVNIENNDSLEIPCCYIDGGVEYNYPLKFCLEKGCIVNEILGVQSVMNKEKIMNIITNDTNILDFFIKFSINTIIHLTNIHRQHSIDNEIRCLNDGESMTLEFWNDVIRSKERRKQLILEGEEDANQIIIPKIC